MRILIVEDNQSLAVAMVQSLRQRNFFADCVPSAEAARAALVDAAYEAMILDLGLPGESGLDLLRTLRKDPDFNLPVVILTARDAIPDRVLGLNAGADDYLVKPCNIDELEARLHAVVRRSHGRSNAIIEHGPLRIDRARHDVTVDGKPVSLSPREFRVLTFLLERKGRVQSRARIEDALYGWGESVESNAVEVHVHNLRRKLGDQMIQTVRGAGYRVPERD
jgi:two-component system, OmpR family, response regulator QseB